MDYTQLLTTINQTLVTIASNIAASNSNLALLKDAIVSLEASVSALQADIETIKNNAVSESLGIYTTAKQDPFERAILVSALKQSNQLQQIIKEIQNPTDISQ